MNIRKFLLPKISILTIILTAMFCGEILAKKISNNAANSDRETIAFLIAIDSDEIAVSKAVLEHLKNAKVRAFAELMIKDHSYNLKETEQLSKKEKITPKKTAALKEQQKKDNSEKNKLKKLRGNTLDKKYIEAMVDGHQKVLKAIDDMLPKIQNPALKQHLTNTRKAVVHHLEMAKEAQKNLNNNKLK